MYIYLICVYNNNYSVNNCNLKTIGENIKYQNLWLSFTDRNGFSCDFKITKNIICVYTRNISLKTRNRSNKRPYENAINTNQSL